MVNRQPSADESSATYEIRLRGTPPQTLYQRFESVELFTGRAETLLFRRVEEPAELDELLEQLLSMGLTLTEVRELPLTTISGVADWAGADARPDDEKL